MARLSTHEDDCASILGRRFTNVHLWLDEFAAILPPDRFGEMHRKYRHRDSVIHDQFVGYALQAAKLHLIRDYDRYSYHNFDTMREDQIDSAYADVVPFLELSRRDSILKGDSSSTF